MTDRNMKREKKYMYDKIIHIQNFIFTFVIIRFITFIYRLFPDEFIP